MTTDPAPAPAQPPAPWRLRLASRRSRLLVSALCALLGFGFVVQVRSTQTSSVVGATREEDLVRILDDLAARENRLQEEIGALRTTRDRLTTGSGRTSAALQEARRRAQVLGVLAGTVPARGPGIILTITDPRRTVTADLLLDTLEELRGAGAEAVQVGGVRVVASTAFVDTPGGVQVDGRALASPYVFTVVGNARTLATALDIPGGVFDTVSERPGAAASVSSAEEVAVTALRPLETPRYARPAPDPAASPRG